MITIEEVFSDINDRFLSQMFKLIENRRINKLIYTPSKYRDDNYVYCERHHIIPRSYFMFNGLPIDNSEYNIICLTAIEHIQIHYFLKEYYRNRDKRMFRAMTVALHRLFNGNEEALETIINTQNISEYDNLKQQNLKDYSKTVSIQMSERSKNHLYVYRFINDTDVIFNKKFINKEEYVDYKTKKWLKHEEFVIERIYRLFLIFMSANFDSVKKHGYDGTIKSFYKACINSLKDKLTYEQKNQLSLRLKNKPFKKMFTDEDKTFMKTHSFEECLEHIKDHSEYSIREYMTRRNLRESSVVYSDEKSDNIIRNNTIEDATRLLGWSRGKVMTRRYKLGIIQGNRMPFTSEEDKIILENTIKNAAKLTGRTLQSVKRRRYIIRHFL